MALGTQMSVCSSHTSRRLALGKPRRGESPSLTGEKHEAHINILRRHHGELAHADHPRTQGTDHRSTWTTYVRGDHQEESPAITTKPHWRNLVGFSFAQPLGFCSLRSPYVGGFSLPRKTSRDTRIVYTIRRGPLST